MCEYARRKIAQDFSVGSISFQKSFILSNGKTIGVFENKNFPTMKMVEEEIVRIFQKKGFSSIERESPEKANCVIRFFECDNAYFEEESYFLIGANVFVRDSKFDNDWCHYENWHTERIAYDATYRVFHEFNDKQEAVKCNYYDSYWNFF